MRLKSLLCAALVSTLGSTALAAEPAAVTPAAPQAARPLSATQIAQVKARIVLIDMQMRALGRARPRSTPSMEASTLQFWSKFGTRDPEASQPGGVTTFVYRDSSILPYGVTPQGAQRALPQRASVSRGSRGLMVYELMRERRALEALLPAVEPTGG